MIIDSHVHVTENGKWFNSSHDSSVAHLLQSMDESAIDKAIVLPIAPYINNVFIQSIIEKYPEKIIGFCSIDPNNSECVPELKRCCASGTFSGVKLHPRLQQTDIGNRNVQLIVEIATENKLQVIIDAWIGPHDTGGDEMIESFIALSLKNPDANFILPHLGGFMYNSMIRVASETKNVWFDISYILSRLNIDLLHREICPVLEKIGHKKIIYGSDFPEIQMNMYKTLSIQIFEYLNWPNTWKNDVFYRNVTQLIGK